MYRLAVEKYCCEYYLKKAAILGQNMLVFIGYLSKYSYQREQRLPLEAILILMCLGKTDILSPATSVSIHVFWSWKIYVLCWPQS